MSDAGGRGRARSSSMHGDEEDLYEIDSATARADGKEPALPPVRRSTSQEPKKQTGQLSKKTINMLTDLGAATAAPTVEGSGKPVKHETEEEAAERELAEQEKAAAAASAAGGGNSGAGSSSRGGAGGAGGGASSGKSLAGRGGKKAGEDKDFDVCVKFLLLGDSGVGKTSLMHRYSEDKFSSSLLSTAGVDYQTQYMDIESKRIKCQIWDTAGQQRFHVITQAYYKGAHGIVLVYDVSDPTEASFHNVRYWMENIQKHANSQTLRILIGNKIDVKGKKIETARGKALADEYGMRFFETSAKDGTGVKDAFHTLARDVVMKMAAAAEGAGGAGGDAKSAKSGDKKDCTIM